MSSSSSNNINNLIREKLSPDEAVKLVELLDREVPVTRYAKFINEDTGEEVDINTALQQQQPRPTSCFEFFSDYMNCHKHVANVMKQSKRNHTLKLNEPDLKVSSVCKKAYQMYEKCTFQAVPNAETAERSTLKESLLQHFVQDFHYHHTTTLTLQEQVEVSVKMLHDPSLQKVFQDMKSSTTYDERDMEDYKNYVQEVVERRFPFAVASKNSSSSSSNSRNQSMSSLGDKVPISEELKALLKKLDN